MGSSSFKPNGVATERVYEILAELSTPEEVKTFLEDLCTLREVEQIAQRMECAEYLLRGDTYLEIIARTDISSTTLSRISRCIQHGSGGYSELLVKFLKKRGMLGEASGEKEV